MPRIARKYLIEVAEVGTYHCIQRCVRGAFLFGRDDASGKDYDHRRIWVVERLEFLAGYFAIDVLAYAVLNNELQLILRNRPDIVPQWTDNEIARRWWNPFKKQVGEGNLHEPTKSELIAATADAARLTDFRGRLASISWFMRSLAEPIARRANKEDECSGHFWEGRYECVPILDEPALAACMVHVDLSPICKGLAKTPAACPSSAAGRVESSGGAVAPRTPSITGKAAGTTRRGKDRESLMETRGIEHRHADWLSPICLEKASKVARSRLRGSSGRASEMGCLKMSHADYVQLLNWTGRELESKKHGHFPPNLAPILAELRVNEENWLRLVRDFSAVFRRGAGTPESLGLDAEKRGTRRREGIAKSTSVFNPLEGGTSNSAGKPSPRVK